MKALKIILVLTLLFAVLWTAGLIDGQPQRQRQQQLQTAMENRCGQIARQVTARAGDDKSHGLHKLAYGLCMSGQIDSDADCGPSPTGYRCSEGKITLRRGGQP
jgi:hypothetical protein